ncbi:MAG: 30S ribosomal protein S6 [Clostridia bacterium]|nr:30S ribosomal protein S6 [Clostridia bacterium]
MRKYECLYIIAPEVSEEDRDAVIAKFSDFVTKNGGKVESVSKVGLKKLAYPIKFKKEGFYVLMNYEAEGNLPKDMEKLMNITESVLRSMSIAK